jgi:hypothetical protein
MGLSGFDTPGVRLLVLLQFSQQIFFFPTAVIAAAIDKE